MTSRYAKIQAQLMNKFYRLLIGKQAVVLDGSK